MLCSFSRKIIYSQTVYKTLAFAVFKENNCFTVVLLISLSWGTLEIAQQLEFQVSCMFPWSAAGNYIWFHSINELPWYFNSLQLLFGSLLGQSPRCIICLRERKKNRQKVAFFSSKKKEAWDFLTLFHGQNSFGMYAEMIAACRQ